TAWPASPAGQGPPGSPSSWRCLARSLVFPGGRGLLDGPEHLGDRRLEQEPLPGHDVAADQDGQFPTAALHEFDVEIGLLSQRRRQTGNVFTDAASDRALPDGHLLHWTPPLSHDRGEVPSGPSARRYGC